MSFKEQLREWLGGLWHDFWHVPYRQVLGICGIALLAIVWAAWHTEAATNAALRSSYYTFSPLLILLIFVLLLLTAPPRNR